MSPKNNRGWYRAAVHSIAGWMVFSHQYFRFDEEVLKGLFIVLLIMYILLVEVMRLTLTNRREYWVHFYPKFVGWYNETWIVWCLKTGNLRKSECNTLTASTWYWTGFGIIYFFFPFQYAAPAILILAFGDPAARIFGTVWGKKRDFLAGKSFAGIAGFVIVSMAAIGISLMLDQRDDWVFHEHTLFSILAAVIIGMIAEVYGGKLDNLLIPISAAATLAILS